MKFCYLSQNKMENKDKTKINKDNDKGVTKLQRNWFIISNVY